MSFKTETHFSFQGISAVNWQLICELRLLPGSPGWLSSVAGRGQFKKLWPRQWFADLTVLQNCLGQLLNMQVPGPIPGASDSLNHQFGTRIDFSCSINDSDALSCWSNTGLGIPAASDAHVLRVATCGGVWSESWDMSWGPRRSPGSQERGGSPNWRWK